ncbi:response regulator [Herbaspirillum sp. alder98]|uniref:response regulator n=1 Tax=Herbaspirillum sp. alder98 TaxID=2913096 RepID=UPI001CD8B131|nr:response regulator [Herbaspirillum sp. alder98]MCA1326786.1 response regulator [Herbaspirillum sp. alder98]
MKKTSKIAIVDDDGSMRDALSALVRSIGMSGLTYPSADDFVAARGFEQADCVITDVQMPGMSGIELLELLRRQQVNLPVIVVTAYPSAPLQARVTAAGNASFMGKPFDGNDMVARIEQALGH